eukprot:6187606-Pleurochrysis_carterae.AAC.3
MQSRAHAPVAFARRAFLERSCSTWRSERRQARPTGTPISKKRKACAHAPRTRVFERWRLRQAARRRSRAVGSLPKHRGSQHYKSLWNIRPDWCTGGRYAALLHAFWDGQGVECGASRARAAVERAGSIVQCPTESREPQS